MGAFSTSQMDAIAMQDSISTGQIGLLSNLGVIEWVELEPVGPEGYRAVLVLSREARVVILDANKGKPRVWKNAGNVLDLLKARGVVFEETPIRLKVKK